MLAAELLVVVASDSIQPAAVGQGRERKKQYKEKRERYLIAYTPIFFYLLPLPLFGKENVPPSHTYPLTPLLRYKLKVAREWRVSG